MEKEVCAECATALEAYPRISGSPDAAVAAAEEFADHLGTPGEFARYVAGPGRDANVRQLLKTFRENVELLVHKTWVEATDEKRKHRVIERLGSCIDEFVAGQLTASFKHFAALNVDLAHLLFGSQSEEPDFIEYCFRIDPKLGLYMWYAQRLLEERSPEESSARLKMLLGIYFLATF